MSIRPYDTFIRPADTTAYASGDLVANSTTAGSVIPLAFDVDGGGVERIRRVKIRKSSNVVTNASFRLHLYRGGAPTVTNGDNGVWLSTYSGYLGAFDVTVDKAFSDASAGVGIPLLGLETSVNQSTTTPIYGLLEARAAYTPTSGEQFWVTLEVIAT
jgi:hypothetical protein